LHVAGRLSHHSLAFGKLDFAHTSHCSSLRPGYLLLDELRPGETINLTFGLCGRLAPDEKDWNAAGTVKSGTITVTRQAE
jgi:hypothetical protein